MIDVQLNEPSAAREYFAKRLAFTTGPVELDRMIQERHNVVIIDVREEKDFQQGHIPGAINLPKSRWHTRDGLRWNAMNIIYCYSSTCHLAARAAHDFASSGYAVMEMEGGFEAWQENNLEVEKPSTTSFRHG